MAQAPHASDDAVVVRRKCVAVEALRCRRTHAVRGAEAHGVDVSENMNAFARRRAEECGVAVHHHHAGFLTYEHRGRPADAVITRSALHQLPDTWKQVALNRVAQMLRPGGQFYLWDVMWSFDASATIEQLPAWIAQSARTPGEGFTKEMFETHVREEFSTFAWVLEGMIERAGRPNNCRVELPIVLVWRVPSSEAGMN